MKGTSFDLPLKEEGTDSAAVEFLPLLGHGRKKDELGRQLMFPDNIAEYTLRTDMVQMSKTAVQEQ